MLKRWNETQEKKKTTHSACSRKQLQCLAQALTGQGYGGFFWDVSGSVRIKLPGQHNSLFFFYFFFILFIVNFREAAAAAAAATAF